VSAGKFRRCLRIAPALLIAWPGLAPLPASQAQSLSYGTLFHTPQQRKPPRPGATGKARQRPEAAPTTKTPGPAETTAFVLNGIMLSSAGGQVSWINGAPVASGIIPGLTIQVQAAPPGALLALKAAGGAILLKVGQRLDFASGQVDESYEWHQPLLAAAAEQPAVSAEPRVTRARPRSVRPALHLHVHTGRPRQAHKQVGEDDDR
jgi:hypothetical protein